MALSRWRSVSKFPSIGHALLAMPAIRSAGAIKAPCGSQTLHIIAQKIRIFAQFESLAMALDAGQCPPCRASSDTILLETPHAHPSGHHRRRLRPIWRRLGALLAKAGIDNVVLERQSEQTTCWAASGPESGAGRTVDLLHEAGVGAGVTAGGTVRHHKASRAGVRRGAVTRSTCTGLTRVARWSRPTGGRPR